MTNKAALLRITCYLAAASLLLIFCNPLASLAFHRPTPEPAPAAAGGQPTFRLDAGLTPAESGAPVYDTLTVDQRRAENLPTALPAALPYYGSRTVYLTFDDGPDPDVTPAILAILSQAGVRATFFVVGSQAEKSPATLRQIHAAGHAIGNHTYDHVYRDLYRSPAAYTAQLRRTDDIIMKTLGVRPRISRAPGGTAGSFNAEYWAALTGDGYREIGWNVNSGDASRARAAQITANIVRQMDSQKFLWSHAIVLMHDGRGHEETVRALPAIIKYFKDRGFEFKVANLETPPAW
jgi:peptidoglycan/xylan/chitin deacetylase (PgdA/CDA1 family)